MLSNKMLLLKYGGRSGDGRTARPRPLRWDTTLRRRGWLAADAGRLPASLVAVEAAPHRRGRPPDVLAVAVGGLAFHRVVHAVAQDLLGPLDGEVARVPRRADVRHHVLGHLLQLFVVALDGAGGLALVEALAHPRLRVLRDMPPVLGDAAVLGEPYDGVY